MGLDISLIKIVKEPIDELNWLLEKNSSELKAQYHDFLTIKEFDNDKELVYYYKEISYQRKGVKRKFYDRYKPDDFVFTLNELKELTDYIMDEYKESFKEEFIKKFQEKENFILIGY